MVGVEMQGADLSEANLEGIDFLSAQMQGADLRDADMRGATLSGAQMQGADLRGVMLWRAWADKDSPANVGLADLRKADFTSELSGSEKTKLRRALENIVDEDDQDDALGRLETVLDAHESERSLTLIASEQQPALVSISPGHLFPEGSKREVRPPAPDTYVTAWINLLIDDLAASDPVIAGSFARRAINELEVRYPPVGRTVVRANAVAEDADGLIWTHIACKLVEHDTPLHPPALREVLRQRLSDKRIHCGEFSAPTRQ